MVNRSLNGVTFPAGSLFLELPLSNASFRGSTIDRAVFEGGTVAGSDFSMAHLGHIRLSGVDIDGATFDHACMSGCELQRSSAKGVRFIGTTMQDASIVDCTFTEAQFTQKNDLLGLSARGSRFVRVSFNGADLRTSHFDRCTFEDCSFANTLLTGVRFEPSCIFIRTDPSEGIRA